MMKVRLGSEAAVLCTAPGFFYFAVKLYGRFYRLALGTTIPGFIYLGRS